MTHKISIPFSIFLCAGLLHSVLVGCAGELNSGGGGLEICDNIIDDDGDFLPDCQDSDCMSFPTCINTNTSGDMVGTEGDTTNTSNNNVNSVEDCDNGSDDDGDTQVDCCDSDCSRDSYCTTERDCSDRFDNDCDGHRDCDDRDCESVPSCDDEDDQDDEVDHHCSDIRSCESCNQASGCGYCATTRQCMEGDLSGPEGASCSDWVYYSEECDDDRDDDPCEHHRGCEDCARDSDCGYCLSSNQCMQGDRSGPDVGSCSNWSYDSSSCDDDDPDEDICSGRRGCDSCASVSGCGYCWSTSRCMEGDSSGPDAGSCSNWTYNSSSCDEDDPEESCSDHIGCGDCTSETGCGYCWVTGDCMEGDSSGPDVGTCGDWTYYSSGCGSSDGDDSCSEHIGCGDCTSETGCGYCWVTGECVEGDSSGPDVGYCGDWSFYSSEC